MDWRIRAVPGRCIFLGQSLFDITSCTVPPPPVQPTAYCLSRPFASTFDSSGNLYIAEEGNRRVTVFVPPFSIGMNASIVIGQPDFTTNNFGTTQNEFQFPTGIAVDRANLNTLAVTDEGNNRVMIFDPPFTNGMNASAVLGQPDFTSSAPANSSFSPNGMNQPFGLAFDSSGNLLAADATDNRVIEFVGPFSNGMSLSFTFGWGGSNSNDLAKPEGIGILP
jgi:DNA-binding beta-propeller fold protein YncE